MERRRKRQRGRARSRLGLLSRASFVDLKKKRKSSRGRSHPFLPLSSYFVVYHPRNVNYGTDNMRGKGEPELARTAKLFRHSPVELRQNADIISSAVKNGSLDLFHDCDRGKRLADIELFPPFLTVFSLVGRKRSYCRPLPELNTCWIAV